MEEKKESEAANSQTVVLKLGSASLSRADESGLNLKLICSVAETIAFLRKAGWNVVLVTSGAVTVGCLAMGFTERPKDLTTKQAIAAVGQSRLMKVYDDVFSHYNQPVAQLLLSRDNLNKSHHYNNALNTLESLFRLGVVPIVNENDTVAVEELRVGDNDTLSALVASLISADTLVLLTDVDALYTDNPASAPDATAIRQVDDVDNLQVCLGEGGKWGTGGMGTKLVAARIATAAGVKCVICHSTLAETSALVELVQNPSLRTQGTHFLPKTRPVKGKKKWLAHGLRPAGCVVIDEGAVKALNKKNSLFAAGIVKVQGSFPAQSNVTISNMQGKEVGRGLVNYDSDQISSILAKSSSEYFDVLGYHGPPEVIHRNSLVLT